MDCPTKALVPDTPSTVAMVLDAAVPAMVVDITWVGVTVSDLVPDEVNVPGGKANAVGGFLGMGREPASAGAQMVKPVLLFSLLFFTMIFISTGSFAQPWRHGMPDTYERQPYGQFCPGMRGDPYGARKPVRTVDEARQALEQYFSATGMKVTVGSVEERRWFFIAEMLDAQGTVIDKAIVDKRTGRIRSIY